MKKIICIAAKLKKDLDGLLEKRFPDCEIRWLEDLSAQERKEALNGADCLLAATMTAELSEDEKKNLGKIGMVQTLSAGIDQADFSLLPRDIKLYSNVGGWSTSIAEHALAMTLCCTRRLIPQTNALAEGRFTYRGFKQKLLRDCRVLILGWGGIGKATALLYKPFGCSLSALGRTAPQDPLLDAAYGFSDLDKALAEADVILLALAHNDQTHHIVNARTLSLMKDDAILVNVARAGLIEHDALEAHLRSHPFFYAAIDPWWQERSHYPAGGDPIAQLPNVVGTSHNSNESSTSMMEALENALKNIENYLAGAPVKGRVDVSEYQRIAHENCDFQGTRE